MAKTTKKPPRAAGAKPIARYISDTHCLPSAWVGRPGLRGDAFHAFDLAVQSALKDKLPILCSGDIIDIPKPDAETVAFLRRQMDRLAEAELDFYYILGNHEQTDPPWLTALHDWPIHCDAQSFVLGERHFYGMDFTPFDRLEEKVSHVPKGTEVVMCHQAWEEFMGRLMRSDGSFAMIPYAQLVLSGDFHRRQTINALNKQGQPMTVLSPGSLVQTAIDEISPRCYHTIYDDLSFTATKLPGRPYLEPPPLLTEECLETFLQEVDSQIAQAVKEAKAAGLPAGLQKPILRVPYVTNIPNVFRRLEEAIGDKAHFFRWESRPKAAEEEAAAPKRRNAVQAGLVGCLEDVVPDTEGDLYKYTRALLEAVQRGERPDVVLQRLKKEFLDVGAAEV